MIAKGRLLRLAMVSDESLFDYAVTIGLIPAPEKIVWLNPHVGKDMFPDYVLGDLIHLGHLKSFGFSAPWELKKYLLGVEGIVRYEADLKRMCGDAYYDEVNSTNRRGLGDELCERVEGFLPSQRIVGTTFRNEKVRGTEYLILSRIVLAPKREPLTAELSRSGSEDCERRLIEAYRIIVKGAPL